MPARKNRPGKYAGPTAADIVIHNAAVEAILASDPLPEDSVFYDSIDRETGDITINGATLVAGLDF